MEVSDHSNGEPGGQELVQKLVSLTGLSETLVQEELIQILQMTGCDVENLTLDELRSAMMVYLESMRQELVD